MAIAMAMPADDDASAATNVAMPSAQDASVHRRVHTTWLEAGWMNKSTNTHAYTQAKRGGAAPLAASRGKQQPFDDRGDV